MARRPSLPAAPAGIAGAIDPALGGRSLPTRPGGGAGAIDLLIARLAEASLGIVTRRDLLDRGVPASAIDHRVATGRLHPLHPGVYAVGHRAVTADARSLAAVLTAPRPAGLAGGHAAAHWGMLSAAPGPIEVVHEATTRRGPAGVRLRRTRHAELTTHRGVPVTTPVRTLVDLARQGPVGRLELALNEGLALKLVTPHALTARSPRLAARLAEAPGYTRQEAERRLKRLILKAQFPGAHFNADCLGETVDVSFARQRVAIEVDGWATHGRRRSFERDRHLDQVRAAAGWRTLRVTWLQLSREPEALIARIAAALAQT